MRNLRIFFFHPASFCFIPMAVSGQLHSDSNAFPNTSLSLFLCIFCTELIVLHSNFRFTLTHSTALFVSYSSPHSLTPVDVKVLLSGIQ